MAHSNIFRDIDHISPIKSQALGHSLHFISQVLIIATIVNRSRLFGQYSVLVLKTSLIANVMFATYWFASNRSLASIKMKKLQENLQKEKWFIDNVTDQVK